MIATELKLNLGSRDTRIPGFKNLDCDSHPNVDFVGDAGDLSQFEDESVNEIYASHILEHFPHTKTQEVLKEWFRVLRPSGVLYVAVPDFHRIMELYNHRGLTDWIINFLWGDQEYKTAFHYTGFNESRLSRLLYETGFKDVNRVGFFPKEYSQSDCSNLISNIDNKSVSLNMVAIK